MNSQTAQGEPTEAAFRQLAQDSHRLWSTLEFRHTKPERGTVHAWLRRPYDLRVEAPDGTVTVETQRPGAPGAGWQLSFAGSPDDAIVRQAEAALYAGTEPPAGVEVSWTEPADDDPMYENYEWVAMLQPRELGRGEWHDQGRGDGLGNPTASTTTDTSKPAPGVVIHRVWAGVRHGRQTWRAEVTPDPGSYEPQCGCCPLLFNAATEAMEYGNDSRPSQREGTNFTHSTRFEVAIDVQTGVCVGVSHLDGSEIGESLAVQIASVNVPMSDSVFTQG